MGILAHAAYTKLVTEQGLSGRKVLAAFIIKRGDLDEGEVVALGTGSSTISGAALAADDRTLHDIHAEVTARSALIKYLYSQVRQVANPAEAGT